MPELHFLAISRTRLCMPRMIVSDLTNPPNLFTYPALTVVGD